VTTEHRSDSRVTRGREEEPLHSISTPVLPLPTILSEDDGCHAGSTPLCAPEHHEEERHGGCYYSSSPSSFELLSTHTSWGGCGRAAAGSDLIDDEVTSSNISSESSSDGSCCPSDEMSCFARPFHGDEGEEECGSTSTSSSIDDEARKMMACRSGDNGGSCKDKDVIEDDDDDERTHPSVLARNTCVSEDEAPCPCCCCTPELLCNEDRSMCGGESLRDVARFGHRSGSGSCTRRTCSGTQTSTSWSGAGSCSNSSSSPYAPSIYRMESGICRLDSGICRMESGVYHMEGGILRMESRIDMDIPHSLDEHVVDGDGHGHGRADCMEKQPIEDGDGRTVEEEVEQKWSRSAESGRCDEKGLQKSSSNSSGLVKEESIRSDVHGYSLHIAAREGSVASILALLDAGIHVDVEDNNGRTPLHEAAQYCKVDAVKVLIRAGCEIDHADVLGSTPLFFAHPEIIPILIEAGANIEHVNYGNCTALEAAAYNDEPECVSALLAEMCDDSSSGDVDEQHKRSLAGALSIAAQKGHLEVFKLLLEVSTSLEDNTSALHAAAKHGHEKVVKALLDHGVLIDGVDENECTALHLACLEGHVAVSELLCSHGVVCQLKNAKGKTALDIAVETGHIAMVSIVAKYQLSTRVKRRSATSEKHK